MRAIVALAVCLAAGCRLPGARPDRSTFFTLTPVEVPDGPAPGSWDVVVGLGPVAIPSYLDRPQLVTRAGPNELRLADTARWAEPLRDAVVRVLRQDLAAASGARNVVLYPWASAAPLQLVVAVDVLRFEPGERGDAELVTRWSVRELVHGRVLAARASRVAQPVQGTGPAAEVAALSRALGALAGEIAGVMREVGPRQDGS